MELTPEACPEIAILISPTAFPFIETELIPKACPDMATAKSFAA